MNTTKVIGAFIIALMMLKAGLSKVIVNVNIKSEVGEIIDFLNRGYEELKASKVNDIIYVLGPTGTGKSTLTHFVAGNPSLLRSIDIDKNSEDFVIQHVSEDKIGNVTLKSKTMCPDLIIDEDKVPYYDCPGFSDTRNTSIEITTTYLTRKAISYAKRLKLVFVVNYQSMLRGISSRNDFLQFVKHVTEFLKNVDLYSNGIMMVASKVDSGKAKAMNKIRSFLKEYRQTLLEEEEENPNPSNALKLIDIFLTKDRIALFKRPTKSGLLSKIPEVMQNRAELLNFINEKLKFVKMNEEDFGYTLSDRSKLNINALGEELNRRNTKLFGQMSQLVIKFYSLSVNYDDIDKLKSDFENTIKILSKISANISMSDYLKAVSQLSIPNLQEHLGDIKKNMDYMKFLESIREEPIVRRTSEWTQALQSCLEYLNSERNWCLFAAQLFRRLSEFDVQRNTSKYDVVNVELWGLGDSERTSNGIVINHQNFETFLRKLMDFEVELVDVQLVEHTKPVQSKIDLLNNILNTTLKTKPIATFENNKLMIKGNFVKFSDLETIAHCNEIRLIEIFALSTVFVDKDFNKTVDLVVIAPKWYIHNTYTRIAVDGNDGDNYPRDTFACGSKRRTDDINGKPGVAGQNANHFFGYGDEIVNSENLHISAVGGNGGRGQNGCNGLDAHEIEIPTDVICNYAKCQFVGQSSGEEFGFLYFNREYWNTETIHVYTSCPGVNGIGGSGGFGGFGGTIELNGMSEIEILIKNGADGSNGVPGKCGMQKNFEVEKSTDKSCTFWILCHEKVSWKRSSLKFNDTTCFESCRNSDFVNKNGISEPIASKHPNSAFSVDQYKLFVRESLHTMSMNRKRATTKFLQSMEQNAKIRAIYDTTAFIDDFNQLEKQSRILKNENNFIDFYQSLLDRILEYAINRTNEIQVNERRVLANLYTAGLSKICRIRSGTEQNLIIDLESYLDVAIDHIRQMEKTRKPVAINQFKNEFQRNLESKIDENHAFIAMNVLPEIEKFNSQIDLDVKSILDQLLKAKHSANVDIDHYDRAMEELQESVGLRGVLKTVTGILSFVDAFAPVVTATVNVANQIAYGFTFGHNNEIPSELMAYAPSAKLKEDYLQIENSMRSSREQKSGLLNILDEALTMASHFSFDDILEPLTKTKNILSGSKRVNLSSTEFDLLHDNVRGIMQHKTDEVKARRNETHALNALEKINKKLVVLGMDADIFSKFGRDESKLNVIEAMMIRSKVRLNELKNFEGNFHNIIGPMVKRIHRLLNGIPEKVIDQKPFELDIAKRHIQNTLKDIRFRLQQIGYGELKFEGDILRTIDNLDGAISTLINIYDQIHVYEEHVRLSTYIANIESTDSSLGISSLDEDFENLNLIIKSNVLLTIFDNAMNGFKQYVFPFAEFYLRRFRLPPELEVHDNFQKMVKRATDELMNLKVTLKEYNSASINDNDNIIHTADFTSYFISSQPFYVWTGNKHKEIFVELLSGRAITVKADITEGSKLNAVKFQFLEIHLKSSNQSNQSKLDEILGHFDVTIVHHGNSYYRCDNKFYMIASQSQRIEYSFEKDTNGLPIRRNNVYNKMRNGDFILSPYALLTISLVERKPDGLKFLKNELSRNLDLELIGRGQYVNPNIDVCLGLDNHYIADEVVRDLNQMYDSKVQMVL